MTRTVKAIIQEMLDNEHCAGLDPFEWNELTGDEQLRARLDYLYAKMGSIGQTDSPPRGSHTLVRIISTCSHTVHLARHALEAFDTGNHEKAEAISLDLDIQLENIRAILDEAPTMIKSRA